MEINKESEIQRFYTEGKFIEGDSSWGREGSELKVKYILRTIPDGFFEKSFANRKFSIVDIGCGRGAVMGLLIKEMKKRGYNVCEAMGFDISDIPLEMARKEWKDINFVNGDIADYGKCFDVGLVADVLEHVENPDAFIRRSGRFCKYMIFFIPLDNNLLVRLRNRYEHLAMTLGHIHYFNIVSALALLKRNGMKIINYLYAPAFMLPALNKSFLAKVNFPIRVALSAISKPLCARILGGYWAVVLAESGIYKEPIRTSEAEECRNPQKSF